MNWDELPKPWTEEQCRSRYVDVGDKIGIRTLAELSGHPKSTVGDWARKGNWASEKRKYLDNLAGRKTIEKTSEKLSDELSKIKTANYECHALLRDYASEVIKIKHEQLKLIKDLPLKQKASRIAKEHSGSDINYWSQVMKRSTDAIASLTGLNYYVDLNAAAGRLEREGYEIIDPSGDE